MRMKLGNGEVYDIPDEDVSRARAEHGAVPVDSVAAPDQATGGGGGSMMADVAGMGAGALDSIGGPRTLMAAGGLGGAGVLLKRAMGAMRQPAAPAATATPAPVQAPAAAKPTRAGAPRRGSAKDPPGLVRVTREDIKNHPELRNYKAGDTIRRVRMEQIKMGPPPESGPKVPESAAKRIEAGKTPTRPIEIVEGSQRTPARAPAQTKEPPYTGGRGASGPELGRRSAAMDRYAPKPAASMAPESDLEEILRRSLEAEGAMGKLGVPKGQARIPLRAGLRSAGGGLLSLLPFIFGAQDIPQQMDEAKRIGFEAMHPDPRVRAMLEELLRSQEGI